MFYLPHCTIGQEREGSFQEAFDLLNSDMAMAQVKQLEGKNAQLEATLAETQAADVVVSLERQVWFALMITPQTNHVPSACKAFRGKRVR